MTNETYIVTAVDRYSDTVRDVEVSAPNPRSAVTHLRTRWGKRYAYVNVRPKDNGR